MQNILIDLGKLQNIYTGLGEVSWQYGNALSKKVSKELAFEFLVPKKYLFKFGSQVQYAKISPLRRYLPELYSQPDLWHALHQDSAYMPGPKIPYLLTIHDLNFLVEKSSKKAEARLQKLQKKINRAAAVAFISDYVQNDALSNLQIKVPHRVIYNGVAHLDDITPIQPEFLKGNTEKIFFSIGVIKEKKNFHVLIDFMEKINQGVLIIAGDNSGEYARMLSKEIFAKKMSGRIYMPGKISIEEKKWLYTNCEAFFFPSKVEGFGIPVVEAMSFGRPVFISRMTSLPEIGGDEAFYWDDFNAEKMAGVYFEQAKTMNEPKYIANRKKRALRFSWENNVNAYLDYYREILG